MKVILTWDRWASRLFCYTLKAYFFHLDLFLNSRRISFIFFHCIDQVSRIAIFWRVSVRRCIIYQLDEYHRTYQFYKSWEIFEEADARWKELDEKGLEKERRRRIKRGREIGAANKVILKEGEPRFKEGCKGTKVEQIPRGGAAKLCRVTGFWKEEAQRDRRKIWGNAVLKRSYDCSFLPSFLPSCTIWNGRKVVFARMNNTLYLYI